MKALIYQIGRLDINAFDIIKFCIDKHNFETSLSSFAIRGYLRKNKLESDIILIYPVSLPFNRWLINNDKFISKCQNECYKLLKDAFNRPDEYLKNPEKFFKSHPHSNEIKDFKVIHSLGEYITSGSSVSFNCHYSDIVLTILIDMIKRYLNDEQKIKRILIDISSGHNIYVSALVEALRYFGVWLKLYNWGKERPIVEIAFSDPIIPDSTEDENMIHIEKQSAKAFFSSPIKHDDIQNYQLSRVIYPEKEQKKFKNRIQSMLESFVLTFSAIKNNIPLAIYEFGYHEPQEVLEILRDIISHTENKLTDKYDNSPNLDKNEYVKVFLTCGFCCGISNALRDNKISKIDLKGIEIQTLRECFRKINRLFDLNLNDIILGNEIDKLNKDIKSDTEWDFLVNLLYSGDKSKLKPQKRNFFAHAGFEGNLTKCKRQNGEVYLKYDQRNMETIKKWLKESI
jgi:CRISPR-associated protein Csx1